jgi:hypothetical protein
MIGVICRGLIILASYGGVTAFALKCANDYSSPGSDTPYAVLAGCGLGFLINFGKIIADIRGE